MVIVMMMTNDNRDKFSRKVVKNASSKDENLRIKAGVGLNIL